LQPVAAPPLPPVRDSSWSSQPVDQFLLAKLEAQGLRPAPRADRAALVRRLTFTLLGLPPTPEEVERFVADPAPDAWERLVDRLAGVFMSSRWVADTLDTRDGDAELVRRLRAVKARLRPALAAAWIDEVNRFPDAVAAGPAAKAPGWRALLASAKTAEPAVED